MLFEIFSEIWFPLLVVAGIWVYSKTAGEPEHDPTWSEIQKKIDKKSAQNLAD